MGEDEDNELNVAMAELFQFYTVQTINLVEYPYFSEEWKCANGLRTANGSIEVMFTNYTAKIPINGIIKRYKKIARYDVIIIQDLGYHNIGAKFEAHKCLIVLILLLWGLNV